MAYDRTQQRRIDAGLCKDCGHPRGSDGTTVFCRPCAKEHAKRASERRERQRKEWSSAQLCFACGAPRDNDTILCTPCRERQNNYTRGYTALRREKYLKQGSCVECGKERYYESRYCCIHFMGNIARKYDVPLSLYEDLLQKLEDTNFTCFYAGIRLIPGINACVDHLYSRSQYPESISDLDNLVWCDKWIHRMKGHMTYQEFIDLCQVIVMRAEER